MEGTVQSLETGKRTASAGTLPHRQHHQDERRLLPRGVRREDQDEAPFGGAVLRDQETAGGPVFAPQVGTQVLTHMCRQKL